MGLLIQLPQIPLKILFGEHPVTFFVSTENYSRSHYCEKTAKGAFQIASKCAALSKERIKQADKGVRHTVLEPGDRVLVRNLRERGGPGKLRSFWENKGYKVLKRVVEDSPVYQVTPESVANAAPRVLHRNLMLPCDDLPLEQPTHKKRIDVLVVLAEIHHMVYIRPEKPCSTGSKMKMMI